MLCFLPGIRVPRRVRNGLDLPGVWHCQQLTPRLVDSSRSFFFLFVIYPRFRALQYQGIGQGFTVL
jgi:hypothetical protein